MNDKIFDLEQRIMDCWGVVDDINDIGQYIGDDEFFAGMDGKQQDKILNLLFGVKELYQLKFERCFSDFEKVTTEYHRRNPRQSRVEEVGGTTFEWN